MVRRPPVPCAAAALLALAALALAPGAAPAQEEIFGRVDQPVIPPPGPETPEAAPAEGAPAAAPAAEAPPAPEAAPAEPPPDPLQVLKQSILRALVLARRGDVADPPSPTSSPLERFLGGLAMADDDLAWPVFKDLATDLPDSPLGELGQARIYVRWRLRDQADAAFARALQIAPEHPVTLVERAIGHRAFGWPDAARADAEAVLRQDPADARALLLVAQLAEDAGAPAAEVEAAYRQALAASADLYEARAALAALAEARGDAAAAREGLEGLAQLNPRNLVLQRRLGRARRDAGDAAGAARAFEAALNLGDGTKETLLGLAGALHQLDDRDGELRALQRLKRLDPRDRAVPLRLIALRRAAGDGPGVDEAARALLALDPKDAGARLVLAERRLEQKDLVGAHAELSAAVAGVDPPEQRGARDRARAALAELRARLGVPDRPLFATNADAVFLVAQRHLVKLYEAHRVAKPELQGRVGLKVRLGAAGRAEQVEIVEDTLGVRELAAGLVVALQEGSWPPLQKTMTMRFDLAPPGAAPPEPPPERLVQHRPRPAPKSAPPEAPPPPKRASSAFDLAAPP